MGSSSIALTQAGTSFYSRQIYYPYGAPRTTEGSALPTDYTFTGQKSDDSTGLMFYNARYYDTTLGRFTQPDTIVPNPLNPQSLNRFAYVLNNPLKYTDPTGRAQSCGDGYDDCGLGDTTPGDSNNGGSNGSSGGKCGDNDIDCNGVADDTPAETGANQYPNGKECWPHCNDLVGCGDYCRADVGVGAGWVLAGITAVCPICAPVTGPAAVVTGFLGISVTGIYASDRYGHNYFGFGGSGGRGWTPISTNLLLVGMMQRSDPMASVQESIKKEFKPGIHEHSEHQPVSEDTLNAFMTGLSANFTVGFLHSFGTTVNAAGSSIEFGTFATPQISLGVQYSWQLPDWLPRIGGRY